MGNIWDPTGSKIIAARPSYSGILARNAATGDLTPEQKARLERGVGDMAAAGLADKHGGKPSDYLGMTALDLARQFGGRPMDYRDFVPMGTINTTPEEKEYYKALDSIKSYQNNGQYDIAGMIKAGVPDNTIAKVFNQETLHEARQAIQTEKTEREERVKAESALEPYKSDDGYDLVKAVQGGVPENTLSKLFKNEAIAGARDQVQAIKDLEPYKTDGGYDLAKAVDAGVPKETLAKIFNDEAISQARDRVQAIADLQSYKTEDGYRLGDAIKAGVPESTLGLLFDTDTISNVKDQLKTGDTAAPVEADTATETHSSASVSDAPGHKPVSDDVKKALQEKSDAAPYGITLDQAQSLADNTGDTLRGYGYTEDQVKAIKSFTPEEVKGIDDSKDALDQKSLDTRLEALKIIKPDATMEDITNKDRSHSNDLSFYAWGKENPGANAAYQALSPEERTRFEKLWQEANYLSNAARNVDQLLVNARKGNTDADDKKLAVDIAKAAPELAKYVTAEGLGSGGFSVDLKKAITDDVKLDIFTGAGIEITQKQIDDVKTQIAEENQQQVAAEEYNAALAQLKGYESNGQYDLQSMLKAGVAVDTLSKVFDIDDIQRAADANKADAAMTPYKQKDGSYNLVAAATDGVSVDTLRAAGFSDTAIMEARDVARNNPTWTPKSGGTPTWREYKDYFGQGETVYDDYVKEYGFGNFVKSAYQQFMEETIPATTVLRDNVEFSDIKGKDWAVSAANLWLLAGAPGLGKVVQLAAGTKVGVKVSETVFQGTAKLADIAAAKNANIVVKAVAKAIGNPEGAKVLQAAKDVRQVQSLENVIKFNDAMRGFNSFSKTQLRVIEKKAGMPGLTNSVQDIQMVQRQLARELNKLNRLVDKGSPKYKTQTTKVLELEAKLSKSYRDYETVLNPDIRKVTVKFHRSRNPSYKRLLTERPGQVKPVAEKMGTKEQLLKTRKMTKEDFEGMGRPEVGGKTKPTSPETIGPGGVRTEFSAEVGEPPPSFRRSTGRTATKGGTRTGTSSKVHELTKTGKRSRVLVRAVGTVLIAKEGVSGAQVGTPSPTRVAQPSRVTGAGARSASETGVSAQTGAMIAGATATASSTQTSTETATAAGVATATQTATGTETATRTKTETKASTKTTTAPRVRPPKVPRRLSLGAGAGKNGRVRFQSGDIVLHEGLFYKTIRGASIFYTKYPPEGMDNPTGSPDESIQVRGEAPPASIHQQGLMTVSIDPTKSDMIDYTPRPPKELRGPKIPQNVRRAIGMR